MFIHYLTDSDPQACNAKGECADQKTVTITFNTFNGKDPKLSQPKATGSVNMASCPGGSGEQCDVEVELTQEITASATGKGCLQMKLDLKSPLRGRPPISMKPCYDFSDTTRVQLPAHLSGHGQNRVWLRSDRARGRARFGARVGPGLSMSRGIGRQKKKKK